MIPGISYQKLWNIGELCLLPKQMTFQKPAPVNHIHVYVVQIAHQQMGSYKVNYMQVLSRMKLIKIHKDMN